MGLTREFPEIPAAEIEEAVRLAWDELAKTREAMWRKGTGNH